MHTPVIIPWIIRIHRHIGDEAFHDTARCTWFFFIQYFLHPVFEYMQHTVRYPGIRTHRHFQVYIHEIGITTREEGGFGTAGGHTDYNHNDGQYEQTEQGIKSPYRSLAFQYPAQQFLIAIHQSWQETILETMDHAIQHIGIKHHQDGHQQQEVSCSVE